jgi:hypothetical protein
MSLVKLVAVTYKFTLVKLLVSKQMSSVHFVGSFVMNRIVYNDMARYIAYFQEKNLNVLFGVESLCQL